MRVSYVCQILRAMLAAYAMPFALPLDAAIIFRLSVATLFFVVAIVAYLPLCRHADFHGCRADADDISRDSVCHASCRRRQMPLARG